MELKYKVGETVLVEINGEIKNEIIGNKSYQVIFFPQKSQYDLPLMLSSLGNRSINTFRKDPIAVPIKKIKVFVMINIAAIIFQLK